MFDSDSDSFSYNIDSRVKLASLEENMKKCATNIHVMKHQLKLIIHLLEESKKSIDDNLKYQQSKNKSNNEAHKCQSTQTSPKVQILRNTSYLGESSEANNSNQQNLPDSQKQQHDEEMNDSDELEIRKDENKKIPNDNKKQESKKRGLDTKPENLKSKKGKTSKAKSSAKTKVDKPIMELFHCDPRRERIIKEIRSSLAGNNRITPRKPPKIRSS